MSKVKVGLIALCAITIGGAALSQTIGAPVEVTAPAQLTRAGETTPLAAGRDMQVGDILQTGATGQIQLRFFDGTRIAIGPNSNFVIEDITTSNRTTADTFVVNTVRGAFRFLGGSSPKESYSVRTPTATLGIRGTIFDIAISSSRAADVILHSGEVEVCPTRGRCAVILGSCAYVSTPRSGRFETAQDRESFNKIIDERFPFMVSQASLRNEFLAPVENCDRVGLTTIQGQVTSSSFEAPTSDSSDRIQLPPETPAPPLDPETPPETPTPPVTPTPTPEEEEEEEEEVVEEEVVEDENGKGNQSGLGDGTNPGKVPPNVGNAGTNNPGGGG